MMSNPLRLFTFRWLLGNFEMDNPFISSSLIYFWRQQLRVRGAGTSLPVGEEQPKPPCLYPAKATCREEQKEEGDT